MKKGPAPDQLVRGDDEELKVPTPSADPSLIRHVLHLGGDFRESPYLSTSDDRARAEEFGSRLYETTAALAVSRGAEHLTCEQLQSLIRVSNKGRAAWSNNQERRVALKYIERHREHLLGYRGMIGRQVEEVRVAVATTFTRVRR